MFSRIRIVGTLDLLIVVSFRSQMNRQLVLANLNPGDEPLNRFSGQRIGRFICVRVAMTALEIVASISDAGTRVTEPMGFRLATDAGRRDVAMSNAVPTGVGQDHPMACVIKQQSCKERAGSDACRRAMGPLFGQPLLNGPQTVCGRARPAEVQAESRP